MSIRRKVSIKNTIQEVVDNTSDLFLNNMPLLVKWAKQSYVRINGVYSCPEGIGHLVCKETHAELPLNAVHVNVVFLGNADLKPGQILSVIPDINVTHRVTGGVENVYIWSGSTITPISTCWHIQDNNIVFDCNLDGQAITISYLKLISDAQGNPMVDEEQVPAIGKYIEFKLGEKENAMKFRKGNLSRLDVEYVNALKKDYHRLVGKAKPITTEGEYQRIVEMFNYPFTGSSAI